ncbi:ABC transporter ATP-binding protein [Piscinibacter sp. Jin2]|uniref:ABC transporter ATP-binding protein n=1 Tax=Aquariibacter lacus TaxID=2801332 RepID=A0A9X0XGQ4_9BURK|nr:ABC transporter ATP-binding protein [Piscinibacter lacus]MBL0720607.1 ABC transporter ATP-binding protein [Piscinibacter lacus]
MALIELRGIGKVYRPPGGSAEQTVHALREVNLDIEAGEFVAIMGSSGSGKSTLMNLIGALDQPSSGHYRLDGEAVEHLSGEALATLRNRRIGFVFQQFNLLPRTTALENVELPLVYAGVAPAARRERARACLEMVGLGARADHTPAQLSGGQQQRVAIARALVNRPSLLLADEPTGALDSATSEEVMRLLARLNAEGITLVLVTHETDIAAWARRMLVVRDGRLVEDRALPPHDPAAGAQAAAASAGLKA